MVISKLKHLLFDNTYLQQLYINKSLKNMIKVSKKMIEIAK